MCGERGFRFSTVESTAQQDCFRGRLFLVFPLKYIQGPKIITFSYLGL